MKITKDKLKMFFNEMSIISGIIVTILLLFAILIGILRLVFGTL